MRTRYTIATSWLVLLLGMFFVLNSGTVRTQASTSDDLKSVLAFANAAVGQPTSSAANPAENTIWDRMRSDASKSAAEVSSPASVSTARNNIDRYIDVANAIDPELGKILGNLCGEQGQDPVELERMIRRYGRNLVALAELKQSDPGFYSQKIHELNLDAEVVKLSRQLREVQSQPDSAENQAQIEELRTYLELLMRSRLKISIRNREHSINQLEEHLETLRDRLNHDEVNFDMEIERQLLQELGELDAVRAARGR